MVHIRRHYQRHLESAERYKNVRNIGIMQNCTELYLQNAPGTSCFMGFMPPGMLQICTKHRLTQNLLLSKGFFHAMGKTREAKFTGYFTILPTHILRETKFIDIFHNVLFSPEYDPTPLFVDFLWSWAFVGM